MCMPRAKKQIATKTQVLLLVVQMQNATEEQLHTGPSSSLAGTESGPAFVLYPEKSLPSSVQFATKAVV